MPKTERQIVTVTLDARLLAAVERVAAVENRSRSRTVEVLLAEALGRRNGKRPRR